MKNQIKSNFEQHIRTTFYLKKELKKRLIREALWKDITITSLLNKIIEEALKEKISQYLVNEKDQYELDKDK